MEDSVSTFIKKSQSKIKALESSYVHLSKEMRSLIQSHVHELQELLEDSDISVVHGRLKEIISSLVHRSAIMLEKKKSRSEKVLSLQITSKKSSPKHTKKPINESLKAYKASVKDLNDVLRNASVKEIPSNKTPDLKKKYNSPTFHRPALGVSSSKLKQAEEVIKGLRNQIAKRNDGKVVEQIKGIGVESVKDDSEIIEMAMNVEKYKLSLIHKKKQLNDVSQHIRNLNRENSELNKNIVVLETHKRKIEEENLSLNLEIQELESLKDEFKDENSELKNRVSEFSSKVQMYIQENQTLNAEYCSFKENNLKLIREFNNLQEIKENLEVENEFLKCENNRIMEEYGNKMNTSQSKADSIDYDNEYKEQNLALNKEICALNEQISKLNGENMPLYDKIAALDEKIRLIEEEKMASQQRIDDLENENKIYEEEIESLMGKLRIITSEAHSLKDSLQEKELIPAEPVTESLPTPKKPLAVWHSQAIQIIPCKEPVNLEILAFEDVQIFSKTKDLEISEISSTVMIEPTKEEQQKSSEQKWKFKEKLLTETLENKSKHIESLQDENSILKLENNVLTANYSENEAKVQILSLTKENARLQKDLYEMEAVEMLKIKVQCLNNMEMLQGKCDQYRRSNSEIKAHNEALMENAKRRETELVEKTHQLMIEIKALKNALELAENPPLLADSMILKRFEHAGVEWVYISQGNGGFWIKKHKVNPELIERIEQSFEKDYGIFKRLCNEKEWIAEALIHIKDMIDNDRPMNEIRLFLHRVENKAAEQSFEESFDLEYKDIRNLMRDYTKLQRTNKDLKDKVTHRDEVINFQAKNLQEIKEENIELKEINQKMKCVKILIDKLVLSLHLIKEKEVINVVLGIQSILLE